VFALFQGVPPTSKYAFSRIYLVCAIAIYANSTNIAFGNLPSILKRVLTSEKRGVKIEIMHNSQNTPLIFISGQFGHPIPP